MKSSIKNSIDLIYERIEKALVRSGRSGERVKLLGATKQVDKEKIIAAFKYGLKSFGENYVQEFTTKYESIPREYNKEIEWHFIGHLQKNKVKYIIDKISLIHSVDKLSLAREIDKRASKIDKIVSVLIEVNLGGEDSKTGIPPEQVAGLLYEIKDLSNVRVTGLMAIPPFFDDPDAVKPYFIKLRELRDNLSISYNSLKELSMGMSGDYEAAIEEGATIVRIGTAIFGERTK